MDNNIKGGGGREANIKSVGRGSAGKEGLSRRIMDAKDKNSRTGTHTFGETTMARTKEENKGRE
jgi:hypothetical protein